MDPHEIVIEKVQRHRVRKCIRQSRHPTRVHPDIQIVALGKRRADVLLVRVPKCEPCSGKLKFTFNNGAAQSELNIEAPSVLRIFADFSGNQWRRDSFKLVSADPVQ